MHRTRPMKLLSLSAQLGALTDLGSDPLWRIWIILPKIAYYFSTQHFKYSNYLGLNRQFFIYCVFH